MAIELRPLRAEEQPQAIRLWNAVYGEMPGYFERYYANDPWYRPGDTVGAWDGDALVSAVHLCRRPVVWGHRKLLCGGIANVATREQYRRRGLSRRLLEMTIELMARAGCHFSLLGTGVPGHYAALGWETVARPQPLLSLRPIPAEKSGPRRPTTDAAVLTLYARSPRPLQFERPAAYFDGWVRPGWRGHDISLFLFPDQGYAVCHLPENADEPAWLGEWRAVDADAERAILARAAAWAGAHGRGRLGLSAGSQFGGLAVLTALGDVAPNTDAHGMVRNVGLSDADYCEVVRLYESGEAAWWPSDGF